MKVVDEFEEHKIAMVQGDLCSVLYIPHFRNAPNKAFYSSHLTYYPLLFIVDTKDKRMSFTIMHGINFKILKVQTNAFLVYMIF